MEQKEIVSPPQTQRRPLAEILREALLDINARHNSRDIIGLVRKPLSHEGGADYLTEEVIARRP
jgi:hypothetical protein